MAPTKPTVTTPSTSDGQKVIRWILAIGGVWVVLTFLVDLEDTADVASAFAVVLMGSVLLHFGPDALKNLGFLT